MQSSKEMKEEMAQMLTQYETYATVNVINKDSVVMKDINETNQESKEKDQNIHTQT